MHKTRLTQNTKAKHTSNAKTKTRRGERKLKSFKFEKNMRALRRSLRGAKEDES